MTTACVIETGLQSQLELARKVQLRLLPERRASMADWEVAFSYESAGFVSGDYVDLIPAGGDAFYFALGDVSGKGMAASMLMSYLHATLRTLLPSDRTLEQVVKIASRTFCQSALPAQFATLVLGKADRLGNVELVSAGHNPVLLVDHTDVEIVAAANVPLGMFCSTDFTSVKRKVSAGSTLFLYTDGITESADEAGNEFDLDRLTRTLLESTDQPPALLVQTIDRAIAHHTDGAPLADDRTMLALRWSPGGV